MIELKKTREFFWDEHIIDTEKTTAELLLHSPVRRERVLLCDMPWEGDGMWLFNIVEDNGLYRMYYTGSWSDPFREQFQCTTIQVCYAESRDGIHWIKPDLGICEFRGSIHNNIIYMDKPTLIDNFMVFLDKNPACLPEEKYKAVMMYMDDDEDAEIRDKSRKLECFVSPDGIHFQRGWTVTSKGRFDTLNVALWDEVDQVYRCYIRDLHPCKVKLDNVSPENAWIRDIRVIESKDFHEWTDPKQLDFGNADDLQLYTNCIQKYYRSHHVFVGFPTRYACIPFKWTDNFEKLTGKLLRRLRMDVCGEPRYGYALTDCVFMVSRDGHHWKRYDEAFVRPGPEYDDNWCYGDCYPALGMIETPSGYPGQDPEISMYMDTGQWMGKPDELYRYTIRVDGFVSYHAPYKAKKIVTKPFTYEGDTLKINFSTSALGYLRIKLCALDGSKEMHTCDLIGDRIDREVCFYDGQISELEGLPVVMEIEMSDADIYSFVFQ